MLLQRAKESSDLTRLEELGRKGVLETRSFPELQEGLQLGKNRSNHIGTSRRRKGRRSDWSPEPPNHKIASVKSLAFPPTVQELKDEDERDQRQIIK